MDNPCYNKSTKTDCPDRTEGCAITCPKWTKYVEERDKYYVDRTRAKNRHREVLTDGHVRRIRKNQKY